MGIASWLFSRRKITITDPIREAEERWRQRNAERRAEGCRCGQPSTKVRYEYGVLGGVPAEIWTCDEHEGVNVWVSEDGLTYRPGDMQEAS